jgi:flagellar protein FlbD
MIKLTRLNRVPLIVNADLIEHVEVTPDTVVALTNGQKFLVLESAEEVVDKVIEFRRAIMSAAGCRFDAHHFDAQQGMALSPAK